MNPGERFSLIRAIHTELLSSRESMTELVDALLSEIGADYSMIDSFTEGCWRGSGP